MFKRNMEKITITEIMANNYITDEEKAVSLAENYYFQDGEIDIIKLAKAMGLGVNITNQLENPAEIFYSKDDNNNEKFEIFVKKLPYLERQRFSVAHEIAHYCLHKDKLKEIGVIDREGFNSLDRKLEIEADRLAGEILMPINCINKFLEQNNLIDCLKLEEKVIEKIAKNFQVSKVASAIRLRDLGFSVRFI